MNKAIELYIPLAMQELDAYLQEENVLKKYNGKMPKEYKGYISSLGAGIIMSGLIPTLAFFASTENAAKADRASLLKMIFAILKRQPHYQTTRHADLYKYSLDQETNKRKLEQDILQVSIALKLCIRTYTLTQ